MWSGTSIRHDLLTIGPFVWEELGPIPILKTSKIPTYSLGSMATPITEPQGVLAQREQSDSIWHPERLTGNWGCLAESLDVEIVVVGETESASSDPFTDSSETWVDNSTWDRLLPLCISITRKKISSKLINLFVYPLNQKWKEKHEIIFFFLFRLGFQRGRASGELLRPERDWWMTVGILCPNFFCFFLFRESAFVFLKKRSFQQNV